MGLTTAGFSRPASRLQAAVAGELLGIAKQNVGSLSRSHK
jgi:hypothetical protein